MDDLFLLLNIEYTINFFLLFFYRFFILSIFVSPKLDLKSESYDHYGNPSTCPSVFVGGMVKHDWFWRENIVGSLPVAFLSQKDSTPIRQCHAAGLSYMISNPSN